MASKPAREAATWHRAVSLHMHWLCFGFPLCFLIPTILTLLLHCCYFSSTLIQNSWRSESENFFFLLVVEYIIHLNFLVQQLNVAWSRVFSFFASIDFEELIFLQCFINFTGMTMWYFISWKVVNDSVSLIDICLYRFSVSFGRVLVVWSTSSDVWAQSCS